MIGMALTFLIVGLVAGLLGLAGVAAVATQIAWVLFLIVKAANRLMPKKEEEAAPTEVELLTEIRDSLRARNV